LMGMGMVGVRGVLSGGVGVGGRRGIGGGGFLVVGLGGRTFVLQSGLFGRGCGLLGMCGGGLGR
jgi:hypothetical protein